MPFTVDPGSYRGGDYWFRGLTNAGNNLSEGIVKAISESRKMEEEQNADQVILNYGKQIGLVTPEIEADYIKGNHAAKTGIVGGILRKFTMSQQQKQEERLAEEAKRVPVTIGDQTFSVHPETAAAVAERAMTAKKEAKTIPYQVGDKTYNIPESEAARLAVSQQGGETADTVDYPDPTTGIIHKVPIRSALGQKILEKTNPAMALEWNYGISPDELFNTKKIKDFHEAGKVDAGGNFTPTDNETGTHIRIGGSTVMPKQAFEFYKNRLAKTKQGGAADTQTAAGSGGPKKDERRTVNGVLAYWDGNGWKPVK